MDGPFLIDESQWRISNREFKQEFLEVGIFNEIMIKYRIQD